MTKVVLGPGRLYVNGQTEKFYEVAKLVIETIDDVSSVEMMPAAVIEESTSLRRRSVTMEIPLSKRAAEDTRRFFAIYPPRVSKKAQWKQGSCYGPRRHRS